MKNVCKVILLILQFVCIGYLIGWTDWIGLTLGGMYVGLFVVIAGWNFYDYRVGKRNG